jgi:hypothetical protein
VSTHIFNEDPANGPDHDGEYRCRCGLPEANKAHRLPGVSKDVRALENRLLGETDDVDDSDE